MINTEISITPSDSIFMDVDKNGLSNASKTIALTSSDKVEFIEVTHTISDRQFDPLSESLVVVLILLIGLIFKKK
jgi:hypothetical protein